MKKRIMLMMAVLCSIIFLMLGVTTRAEDQKSANLIDDTNFSIGAGVLLHFFSKVDDFRKGSIGEFAGKDDIKTMPGVQLNTELNLNAIFYLDLPVGLASGYRFQFITISREYSATIMGTTTMQLTQDFDYMNHIGYFDILLPLGSRKYCILGTDVGCGYSKFTYAVSGTGITKEEKSSSGIIVPVGVFIDWGADGIGARFGYDYCFSKYNKILGSKPSADGHQVYLNLRYAF